MLVRKMIAVLILLIALVACQSDQEPKDGPLEEQQGEQVPGDTDTAHDDPSIQHPSPQPNPDPGQDPSMDPSQNTEDEPLQDEELRTSPYAAGPWPTSASSDAIQVVAEPEALTVLINKLNRLPAGYEPPDLVEPQVTFSFEEENERRYLRQAAARALEELFQAAADAGHSLMAVSGYRSEATQRALYNRYVERDGREAADLYSAWPGHSEHQTGLAMDVASTSWECVIQDCFADSEEAAWLAQHAHLYGFVIRYPKGKEDVTGYQYEPWHLRYVGVELAMELATQGITLEEYYNVVPVDMP